MEYLDEGQLSTLAVRLRDLTLSARLSWKPADNEYRFTTRTSKFGYALRSRDEDDFHPYVLEIHQLGEQAGKLQEADSSEYRDLAEPLADMYTFIKRRALGIEQVARELFADLDQLDS